MSRSERPLDLAQVLRRHRLPASGHKLAEETGVSIRTLYRDIATLQGQGARSRANPGSAMCWSSTRSGESELPRQRADLHLDPVAAKPLRAVERLVGML